MATFRNRLVQSYADPSQQAPVLGEVDVKDTNTFYGSDTVCTPIAKCDTLRPNYRGKYQYEADYPVWKKNGMFSHHRDVCFFDIETDFNDKEPFQVQNERADAEITCCTFMWLDGRKHQAIGEENVLIQFHEMHDTTVWVAWNAGFDISYVLKRMAKADPERQSFNSMYPQFGDANWLDPVLDYTSLYKKYIKMNEKSFHLKDILLKHLGKGKVEFKGSLYDLYRNDPEKYYAYNRRDVEGMVELESKLHIIKIAQRIIETTGCMWQDLLHNSTILEAFIWNVLHSEGWTFKNKTDHAKTGYEGAIVYDPIGGLHRGVRCYDVNSMYPYIIKGFNISPETQVTWNTDGAPVISTPTGSMYSRNSVFSGKDSSLFGEITTFLLEQRTTLKAVGDNVGQMAMKILANSLYGVMGSQYFRLTNNRIAQDITSTGKAINLHIVSLLEGHDVSTSAKEERSVVLWGHTDSIFVKGETDQMEFINNKLFAFSQKNKCLATFKVKDEYGLIPAIIFLNGIKSQYYLLDEAGEFKKVGGVSVKSNVIPETEKWINKWVPELLKGHCSIGEIRREIEKFAESFDMFAAAYYRPYKHNWSKVYETKPRQLEGLEVFKYLFPTYQEQEERGIIIELIGAPRNARCRKAQETCAAIPASQCHRIKDVYEEVQKAGLTLNLKRTMEAIFKPLYDVLENVK